MKTFSEVYINAIIESTSINQCSSMLTVQININVVRSRRALWRYYLTSNTLVRWLLFTWLHWTATQSKVVAFTTITTLLTDCWTITQHMHTTTIRATWWRGSLEGYRCLRRDAGKGFTTIADERCASLIEAVVVETDATFCAWCGTWSRCWRRGTEKCSTSVRSTGVPNGRCGACLETTNGV